MGTWRKLRSACPHAVPAAPRPPSTPCPESAVQLVARAPDHTGDRRRERRILDRPRTVPPPLRRPRRHHSSEPLLQRVFALFANVPHCTKALTCGDMLDRPRVLYGDDERVGGGEREEPWGNGGWNRGSPDGHQEATPPGVAPLALRWLLGVTRHSRTDSTPSASWAALRPTRYPLNQRVYLPFKGRDGLVGGCAVQVVDVPILDTVCPPGEPRF